MYFCLELPTGASFRERLYGKTHKQFLFTLITVANYSKLFESALAHVERDKQREVLQKFGDRFGIKLKPSLSCKPALNMLKTWALSAENDLKTWFKKIRQTSIFASPLECLKLLTCNQIPLHASLILIELNSALQ